MKRSNLLSASYLEPGRERRRGGTGRWLLVLVLLALLVAFALLISHATASGSPRDCQYGESSAIGPIDEQGRGQTIPEMVCLEP